jgi:hypothetical protein
MKTLLKRDNPSGLARESSGNALYQLVKQAKMTSWD